MASNGSAAEHPWSPPYCSVVAMDTSSFSYRGCSFCEQTLSASDAACRACSRPGSKLLYRVLLSVGTVDRVMVVVCFDRVAKDLMGCSADEWSEFLRAHPSAGQKAGELLRGEMLRMTLTRSKRGNAEHLRVASLSPLRAGFRTVIDRLRKLYGAEAGAPSEASHFLP